MDETGGNHRTYPILLEEESGVDQDKDDDDGTVDERDLTGHSRD